MLVTSPYVSQNAQEESCVTVLQCYRQKNSRHPKSMQRFMIRFILRSKFNTNNTSINYITTLQHYNIALLAA